MPRRNRRPDGGDGYQKFFDKLAEELHRARLTNRKGNRGDRDSE